VQLNFFPVGHFLSGTNGTAANAQSCPTAGNDKDCVGDKYESCLLSEMCGGVACNSTSQMRLASFLECFEGKNDAAPTATLPCASAAGFDVAAVAACASDESRANAAFAAVQTAAKKGLSGASCFPWIVVDGEVESKDPSAGCFGKDAATAPLLPILCKAAPSPKPAGCAQVEDESAA